MFISQGWVAFIYSILHRIGDFRHKWNIWRLSLSFTQNPDLVLSERKVGIYSSNYW